ncbi:UDP-glucose 6-dehydrogenase [candidate division WOR-1 bacterium RIFOXYC2_FULL_37_10]|uniref:UDP-glucose 6-dehydrogenase n=1 Tax=candidate division WOR-1 bacterium RIFOXYB2_FULL_37_13 TaxID=1802579 RepID=A0A1F4SNW4_UNCSA|nr:MAG: UDP-glucose 6-dehydrogenase [candidate division WOR-1 bacterium RIFOXYB2_FULL_37_13]OGC35065.1 MAG: UDP-glucose 6-dehydrogenase [candidate division WOR-1 bacterium RIFOXYC2_FULL_37_10]
MKLAVIGTGYVGLVTGACFANLGNDVICVDKDLKRLETLSKGDVPFYEPGLPELVSKNHKAKRLVFSHDISSAVLNSEVIFIAVGTPPKSNGQADISAVISVAQSIAKTLKSKKKNKSGKFKVIVNKSTVPVGMGDIVTKILIENKISEKDFSVVSNPEFLREGSAISDFMNPDRIVVGASNNRAFNLITELYRPLNAHVIFTSVKSAELIKYASNAFLATKISFINEIANICERVGSDVLEVANAMGLDKRIGRQFLNAGIGYGGSCFPKDVLALMHLAREQGYDPQILSSVTEVNDFQSDAFVGKILKELKNLRGKRISVLGLSFKPDTDDLREAPSLKVINSLLKKGAQITVYDPAVSSNSKKELKELSFADGVYEAIDGADAIIVVTEWAEFKEIDFDRAKKLVKGRIIFDGRNIYDPKRVRESGFKYIGVGR